MSRRLGIGESKIVNEWNRPRRRFTFTMLLLALLHLDLAALV